MPLNKSSDEVAFKVPMDGNYPFVDYATRLLKVARNFMLVTVHICGMILTARMATPNSHRVIATHRLTVTFVSAFDINFL